MGCGASQYLHKHQESSSNDDNGDIDKPHDGAARRSMVSVGTQSPLGSQSDVRSRPSQRPPNLSIADDEEGVSSSPPVGGSLKFSGSRSKSDRTLSAGKRSSTPSILSPAKASAGYSPLGMTRKNSLRNHSILVTSSRGDRSSMSSSIFSPPRPQTPSSSDSMTGLSPLEQACKLIQALAKENEENEALVEQLRQVLRLISSSQLFDPNAHSSGSPSAAAAAADGGGSDKEIDWLKAYSTSYIPKLHDVGRERLQKMLRDSFLWPSASAFSQNKSQMGAFLGSWDYFNVFDTAVEDMMTYAEYMFQHFGLTDIYQIPHPVLRNFILAVKSRYKENPYHNFRHAFDVTQNTFCYLCTTNAVDFLSALDILALLITSMCHDLDHPGNNNDFEIRTLSSLALQFNDQSVLEHHHLNVLFEILAQPSCNILANLSADDFIELRRNIISMVLATDMSCHFEIVAQLKAKVAAEMFDCADPRDKLLLLRMILHLSDISNPVKPFRIALKWTTAITAEFFRQGSREKALGIKLTPMCDEENHDVVASQVGFLTHIVKPLFSLADACLDNLTAIVRHIDYNTEMWNKFQGKTLQEVEEIVKENPPPLPPLPLPTPKRVISKSDSIQESIEETIQGLIED
eukprot:Rmarinus@m.10004